MSFQQGLSGLNATSKSLEVIGNNIANANTHGAKSSRAEFADLYAASLNGGGSSAVGIGVRIADVTQQFTQGNISVTENPWDLAVNGVGFFIVGDGRNPNVYSRNGQFKVVQGNGEFEGQKLIADNSGKFLHGIPSGGTTLAPLVLPTGLQAAQATTEISIEMNLNKSVTPLSAALPDGIDALNRSGESRTVHYTTSQSVFDGAGTAVGLSYYFRQLQPAELPGGLDPARPTWAVYMTAAANGAAETPVLQDPAGAFGPRFYVSFDINGADPQVFNGDASAVVDGNGAPVRLLPVAIPETYEVLEDGSNGAKRSEAIGGIDGVMVDLASITQYSSPFGVTRLDRDGYRAGQLTDFSIDETGRIIARYSNGETQEAGRLQLANFPNPQGLKPIGGNLWESTVPSGEAVINYPGEGGNGALQQGALEESNVDLTAELVNMITAQRIYQANAQTIKTIDQVMQTLVNLR